MKRLKLNRILKNKSPVSAFLFLSYPEFLFLVYHEKMNARIKAYYEENKSLQENFWDSGDFNPRFKDE